MECSDSDDDRLLRVNPAAAYVLQCEQRLRGDDEGVNSVLRLRAVRGLAVDCDGEGVGRSHRRPRLVADLPRLKVRLRVEAEDRLRSGVLRRALLGEELRVALLARRRSLLRRLEDEL